MDESRRASDFDRTTAFLEKHGKLLALLAAGAIGYLRLSWTVDALKKESDARQTNADKWRTSRTGEITELKLVLKAHDKDIEWLKRTIERTKP